MNADLIDRWHPLQAITAVLVGWLCLATLVAVYTGLLNPCPTGDPQEHLEGKHRRTATGELFIRSHHVMDLRPEPEESDAESSDRTDNLLSNWKKHLEFERAGALGGPRLQSVESIDVGRGVELLKTRWDWESFPRMWIAGRDAAYTRNNYVLVGLIHSKYVGQELTRLVAYSPSCPSRMYATTLTSAIEADKIVMDAIEAYNFEEPFSPSSDVWTHFYRVSLEYPPLKKLEPRGAEGCTAASQFMR